MSAASRATTPTNQPEQVRECPGAPARLLPAGLTVNTSLQGRRLVFAEPIQAPGAPHKVRISAELRDMSASQKLSF